MKSEIDPRYFERPYFIAPADKHSGEGYVVIREALKKTGKAGLAQLTIGGREWLVAITALGDGLLMEMLRYADELKEPDQFFDEVPTGKPDKEMVDLAVELIERKAGKFTPDQFEDHYATALRELVQKKLKGHKIKAPHEEAAPGGAKVIDLMSALQQVDRRRQRQSEVGALDQPARAGRTPRGTKKRADSARPSLRESCDGEKAGEQEADAPDRSGRAGCRSEPRKLIAFDHLRRCRRWSSRPRLHEGPAGAGRRSFPRSFEEARPSDEPERCAASIDAAAACQRFTRAAHAQSALERSPAP